MTLGTDVSIEIGRKCIGKTSPKAGKMKQVHQSMYDILRNRSSGVFFPLSTMGLHESLTYICVGI